MAREPDIACAKRSADYKKIRKIEYSCLQKSDVELDEVCYPSAMHDLVYTVSQRSSRYKNERKDIGVLRFFLFQQNDNKKGGRDGENIDR